MAKPFDLGVIVSLSESSSAREVFERVRTLGLATCQLAIWTESRLNDETAQDVKEAMRQTGVEITTLWVGWPGPAVWNFTEGPVTLGLVPLTYREMRLRCLMKGAEIAKKLGVPSITTHVGFIPENPTDPVYPEFISAMRYLASHCHRLGVEFWFETGQETPVTLLRAIQDIGTPNLGINLDPANLILYGKGNPVDALDVFGRYVRGVHVKDGVYPTDGRSLGKERPVGEGRVDFPALIRKLKDLNFQGALTIEREISGEQQTRDILKAIDYLKKLI